MAGVNGQFNGTIAGNLHGSIAAANVAGKIGKNINLTIDDNNAKQGGLLITKDAIVGGGLTYTAGQDARIESASSIVGPVVRQTEKIKAKTPIDFLAGIFYKLSALFLIGLVLLSLKKKVAYDVSQNLEIKNWQSSLIGLGAFILTPAIILFFVFTIIGIPLALLLIAAYLMLLTLGAILSAFFVGNTLLKSFIKKPLNVFAVLIFGLTIFVLLASIPYIGWSFILVFMAYGLGGILITIKNYLYA